MSTRIHRLSMDLLFPEGVCPGEQSLDNHLMIARDGVGRPVLRGTAFAGALRHAWQSGYGNGADVWFGAALNQKKEAPSPLRVPDTLLMCGSADEVVRTHNAIDRHRGAPLDGGLFSLECLPPGTTCSMHLWLQEPEEADGTLFLQQLLRILLDGLTLGGNAARGIGRVSIIGDALHRVYDLNIVAERLAYVTDHRAWRSGNRLVGGEPLESENCSEAGTQDLVVDLVLAVPGAEDLLISDGVGLDFQMEPQWVRMADGREVWRIPGSSLRGVFRSWFTRLAARAGEPVADTVKQHRNRNGASVSGDQLAWGFDDKDTRENKIDRLSRNPASLAAEVTCPIMQLFGSAYAKGRFHVTDALSKDEKNERQRQHRMHVAIDRITGGANEGFLFDNAVLTHGPEFHTRIRIRAAQEKESTWLLATLRAINAGILRVGSSKAGGVLSVNVVGSSDPNFCIAGEQTKGCV